MKFIRYLLFIVLICSSCGTKNAADCDGGQAGVPCSERTQDEEARLALERGDYESAVTILEKLVADQPENYQRFALLAAAYAAKAGFDLFKAASQGNTTSSESGGLTSSVGKFLPTPQQQGDTKYAESIVTMGKAVATLKAIPAAKRSATATEKYSTSAALQLTLYTVAYSVMYMNKFAYSSTTGAFDPSKLATMTAADAAAILGALADAGASYGGESGEALKTSIDKALTDINGQPGASDNDKLQSYIATNSQLR